MSSTHKTGEDVTTIGEDQGRNEATPDDVALEFLESPEIKKKKAEAEEEEEDDTDETLAPLAGGGSDVTSDTQDQAGSSLAGGASGLAPSPAKTESRDDSPISGESPPKTESSDDSPPIPRSSAEQTPPAAEAPTIHVQDHGSVQNFWADEIYPIKINK